MPICCFLNDTKHIGHFSDWPSLESESMFVSVIVLEVFCSVAAISLSEKSVSHWLLPWNPLSDNSLALSEKLGSLLGLSWRRIVGESDCSDSERLGNLLGLLTFRRIGGEPDEADSVLLGSLYKYSFNN